MSDWLTEWRTASGHTATSDTLDEDAPEVADEREATTADQPDTRPAATAAAAPTGQRPRSSRQRNALYPLAVLAAFLIVGTIAVLSLTGGGDEQPADTNPNAIATAPVAPSTDPAATSAVASPATCPETNTDTRLVTASPGDIHTPPGVVAAFEHAYFTERDPIAAAEHLAPSMRTTAAAIRGVMDNNFPPGTAPVPYCATITPWNDPDTWAVSVDWTDERTDDVKTWTAIYEIKTVDGRLRITAQRDT
jgi:hypothetical protein